VRGIVLLHDAQIHVENLWLEACALRIQVPGEIEEQLVARLEAAQAHEDASNRQAEYIQETANRLYNEEVKTMECSNTKRGDMKKSKNSTKTRQERRVKHYNDLKNKAYTHGFVYETSASAGDACAAKRLYYNEMPDKDRGRFGVERASYTMFVNWLWSMRNTVSIR
jgi:hypothetical protein